MPPCSNPGSSCPNQSRPKRGSFVRPSLPASLADPKVRTAEEIEANYKRTFNDGALPEGLSHYWPFSGSSKDHVEHSYDSKMQGHGTYSYPEFIDQNTLVRS